MNSCEAANSLLQAENAKTVTEILDLLESKWEIEWRNHGPADLNNIQVVFNQAPDPVDAFSELLTNSIDAILIKRYCEKYNRDTYNSEHELVTAEDAVEDLFDDDIDGETIEVVADGGDYPNLIVRDTGGGQGQDIFEDRFLNLASGAQFKADWPFAQGRFKMGASAVHPHCGEEEARNYYKFVVSASHKKPGSWSWSLIKYEEDSDPEGFKYLSLPDGPPTFEGEVDGQDYGTFVKVYEYQLPHSEATEHVTNITDPFVRLLNRSLVDPAIPIKIRETRERFKKGASRSTANGIFGRLDEPNVERHLVFDKTHPGYRFSEPFGERQIRIIVFKDTATIEDDPALSLKTKQRLVASTVHRDQAVFYLVNGQNHAQERRSFLTGKTGCQFPHTGEDMLVFIDLSDFADKSKHNLIDFVQFFSPSRDRLGESKIASRFREELKEALVGFQPLIDEEDRRRSRSVKRRHDKKVEDMVQNYLDRDPNLSKYFQYGSRLRGSGTEDTGDYEYNPPNIPNEFKIIKSFGEGGVPKFWDGSKGPYVNRQAVNRKSSVWFWLNAPDDYFTRRIDQGGFQLNVASIRRSFQLNRGVLTLTIDESTGFEPGDELSVVSSVSRPGRDPLEQTFKLEYVEPAEPQESVSVKSDQEDRQTQFAPPDPIEVYEDGNADMTTWDEVPGDPFTEDDYVRLVDNGSDAESVEMAELDVYVNMDGGPIRHFFDRYDLNDTGKEMVPEKWKVGLMLYSISEYKELLESGFEGNGMMPTEVVEATMRGTAQWLLSTHINDDELGEFTV